VRICEGELIDRGGSDPQAKFLVEPGTYRPSQGSAADGFSSFRGGPVAGTWTLTVTDNRTGNVGSLQGWSLQFRSIAPSPTDCDANSQADACEIAANPSLDSDLDGELDRCERARGDLNLDGEVGAADLTMLLGLWGTFDPPYGDFNGDGVIGAGDLTFLLGVWSLPRPAVVEVNPAAGPLGGGTTITITGANLLGTSEVTIGGIAATNVTLVDATTVTAVTPSGTAGEKDVRVTTPNGTAVAAGAFTYLGSPVITGVSPVWGPIAGGTEITSRSRW
jgi:hypothetical protein